MSLKYNKDTDFRIKVLDGSGKAVYLENLYEWKQEEVRQQLKMVEECPEISEELEKVLGL